MQCQSVEDIISIAATAEALAVTVIGEALAAAERGELALTEDERTFLRAARAAEQAHYEVLTAAGAKPLTLVFTVPDTRAVSDPVLLLRTAIGLEEAFIAAYCAAAQQFASLGQPDLVRVAVQIGGVEAEHRALLRHFAILRGALGGVPDDVAYQKALFSSVGSAADALIQLGWIGGSGPEIRYPGPGAIDTRGVKQLRP
jgi:hypothetical protein